MNRIAMAAVLALCLPLGACSGEGSGEGDRANTARDGNHRSDSGAPNPDPTPPPDGGGPGQPGDPVMDAARRLDRRGARRRSASTRSATRRSGAARCSCTRRSPARRTAASAPGSVRPRRAGARPQGRRRRAAAGARRRADPARRGRSRRSGDDARAAPARRGRRRQGLLRRRRRAASVGIQCALCHSTVDDSFAPGIGHRLDGWANRDLDVGAIIAAGARPLGRSTALLGVDEATVRDGARAAGGRASSTPSCSSTARRSGPTAKTGGDADPAGLRAGRREPAHLHRLGLGHVLERVRRQPRDARPGHLLRSAPRRRRAVPGRGGEPASATSRQQPGPDHAQAGRAALLPARAPRRRRRRRAASTPAAAERGRALFEGKARCAELPRAAALHRAGLEPAHARGDRHRRLPGRAARPTAATAPTPLQGLWSHAEGRLLPRRPLRDPARRGRPLRRALRARARAEEQKQDLVQYLLSL